MVEDRRWGFAVLVLGVLSVVPSTARAQADTAAVRSAPTGAFVVTRSVLIDAPRAEVWAAATGDLTPWWDHSVSGDPHRMYVEPEPGGCFCEIFDASGDGVVHATVTMAREEQTLRYVGPLGFLGNALHMVTTWTFEREDGGTRVTVEVHGSGEVHDDWPDALARVWRHFLVDRLEPYVEGTLEEG